jgi:hypothetical protein
MSSQYGNHAYESPQEKWLEEQRRKEREQGIYRSEYNSQIDH